MAKFIIHTAQLQTTYRAYSVEAATKEEAAEAWAAEGAPILTFLNEATGQGFTWYRLNNDGTLVENGGTFGALSLAVEDACKRNDLC